MEATINWKFEIGDIVTTATSMKDYEIGREFEKDDEYKLRRDARPMVLQIETRHADECPGGTQLFYTLLYFGPQGYGRQKFHEHEIVAYPTESVVEK